MYTHRIFSHSGICDLQFNVDNVYNGKIEMYYLAEIPLIILLLSWQGIMNIIKLKFFWSLIGTELKMKNIMI